MCTKSRACNCPRSLIRQELREEGKQSYHVIYRREKVNEGGSLRSTRLKITCKKTGDRSMGFKFTICVIKRDRIHRVSQSRGTVERPGLVRDSNSSSTRANPDNRIKNMNKAS